MENKYEKMTEEEFIKETSGLKSTSELHFFVLLNTLNLILHNGYHYCLCEKYQGPTNITDARVFVHFARYR